MTKFNTISIFETGGVEILTPTLKNEKKAGGLVKLQAVIDNLFENKTENSTDKKEYSVIRIFSDDTTVWHTKDKKEVGFRIKTSVLNKAKLNALVTELLA